MFFQLSDKDKDGCVSVEEYLYVLKRHKVHMEKGDLKRMFYMCDTDCDGKVSYDRNKQVKAAFNAYDRNKDGRVSKQEMASLSGNKLSKKAIELIFEKYDKNHDGYLNKDEMAEMMQSSKKKSSS